MDVRVTSQYGGRSTTVAVDSLREALREVFPHGWRLCAVDDEGAYKVEFFNGPQLELLYVQSLAELPGFDDE